jgi:hypothetical protein
MPILEQFLFDHEYMALLIVIGGHVGGQPINSVTQKGECLLLIRSIDLIKKEILILTNRYSMNNKTTFIFSKKIKQSFETCDTLLY